MILGFEFCAALKDAEYNDIVNTEKYLIEGDIIFILVYLQLIEIFNLEQL